MTNPHLTLVAPTTIIGTVGDRPNPPRRKRNAELRAREYLTDGEIARLIAAASGGTVTATAMPAWCWSPTWHGLRAAELVTLRWDAIDFAHGRLHVRRLKGGSESIHPLSGRGSCGPCAGLSGSKSRLHRSFSRRSGGRRSRRRASAR